jgi:diacylglycerol kinase
MSDPYRPPKRSWLRKFRDALAGAWQGVRGQSSFYVHFAVAATVVVAAAVLCVSLVEWCLLALCITIVLAAEMFNSALESLAKAIDAEHNLHLEAALNIGSAAVLLAAIGAAAVGLVIFLYRLSLLLSALGGTP